MSAQTSYNFYQEHGVAGGFYDISHHVVDSRNNEEVSGKVKFGLGLVEGSVPGKNVKLPTADSTKKSFEGVVVNSHSNEMDIDGVVSLRKGQTVGLCREGRIHVRIVPGTEIKYGDELHLIVEGDNAGYFSNEGGIKLNGYFIDGKDSGDTAPAYVIVDKMDDAQSSASTENSGTEVNE